MKKKYIYAFCFFLFTLKINAQNGIVFNKMTWEAAKKEAAKTKKLIFLDAYTTWCLPCKVMEENVFPQESVGNYFNNTFICLKMDMEKGEGVQLARILNIHAFPTFIFADENGKILHIDAGGKSIAKMIEMGQTALDPTTRMAALDEKFAQGQADNLDFLKDYVEKRFLLQNNSHGAAADAYLAFQNDLKTSENVSFIMKYIQNPTSKSFQYIIDNQAFFSNAVGERALRSKIENCIYNELNYASYRSDTTAFEKILKQQYGERADYYLARYKVVYAKTSYNIPMFLNAAESYFKRFPPEDPAEWSNVALQSLAFPNEKDVLKKALEWTDKGIKQEDNFDCRLAKARIYQVMGKNRKAKKYAKKAIAFAQKNGEDASKAMKLLEK